MFPYCKMSNKQPQDFDPYRYSQLLFLQVFCSLFFFTEFIFPIIPSFVMLKLFQKQKVFSSTKLAELMRSKLRHNLDNVIHNFFFFLVIQNGTVVVVQMFKFYLSARQKKKELLLRNISNENLREESLLHLKNKIKDVALSSFKVYKKNHKIHERNLRSFV